MEVEKKKVVPVHTGTTSIWLHKERLLQLEIVIASNAKQSHWNKSFGYRYWCDCFALLAMTDFSAR